MLSVLKRDAVLLQGWFDVKNNSSLITSASREGKLLEPACILALGVSISRARLLRTGRRFRVHGVRLCLYETIFRFSS